MDSFDEWQQLRLTQCGVVSVRQLRARGLTDNGVRAQIAAGRWQRWGDGVVITYSGPPTLQARWWAAILACRGEALLSHETAGELYGLLPPDPARPVHVTVPYGTSASRTLDVVVHRSRAYAHIGVDDAEPPMTTLPHTVLDLAVAEPEAASATRVVHRLAVAGRVHAGPLRAAIDRRRPRRYRQALLDGLDLLTEGVLSELELRYTLDVEKAHGLPTGDRQVPVVVDGVRRYEDIRYDLPGGRVVVRLDGDRYHADRETRHTDRRRAVAAAVLADTSIPFGWDEATCHPCRTAHEVAAVLGHAGWTGSPVRCPACERNPW